MARPPIIKIEKWQEDFLYLTYPTENTDDIAKILNQTSDHIVYLANKKGLYKSNKIYPGKKFGKLTVIKPITQNFNAYSIAMWKCRCECGIHRHVRGNKLLSGIVNICNAWKCKTKSNENIPEWFFKLLIISAKKRNILFNLTKKDLEDLFKKQNGRCAFTGIKLWISNIARHRKDRNKTIASIDRINPKIGYTKDNVQFVHKYINYMKWKLTNKQFFTFCKLTMDNMKNE